MAPRDFPPQLRLTDEDELLMAALTASAAVSSVGHMIEVLALGLAPVLEDAPQRTQTVTLDLLKDRVLTKLEAAHG